MLLTGMRDLSVGHVPLKANLTYFFLSAKSGRKYTNFNTGGQRLFTLALMEEIPLKLALMLLLVIPQARLVDSSPFYSIPLSPVPAQAALLDSATPAPGFRTSKYPTPIPLWTVHSAHQ